ncbi:MAG: SDR family oxidoreductase [Alphaproteobacteria bacterium]|nr:SDR family oxidoreductase [Alphaproteobacteria bacterium]
MTGISYPHRLEGKRALVTAAGQGIGKASAIALANAGASVIATDINDDTLADLSEEASTISRPGNISCFRLDVLNKDDVNQAISDIQPDILFNCAGFVHHGSILDASEDEWDVAFELNVRAMMRTIKAALPSMIKRGTGSIINMSSACSSIIGAPDRFVYGTSKAAVLGLTKSVARDYITTGVRCNAICPGTVDSPSLHDRLRATGDYDAAMKAFVARQPMGRIATAEEIAALVVYLASDESAFTTGQAHLIDGGWAG